MNEPIQEKTANPPVFYRSTFNRGLSWASQFSWLSSCGSLVGKNSRQFQKQMHRWSKRRFRLK